MSEKLLTKEEQKDLAVKALATLGCYKPYLNAFKRKTDPVITMYEGFGGYYLDPKSGSHETELIDKIKEVEETYGGTVYAVIHNLTSFGECYSMLWVSQYPEEKDRTCGRDWAMAYVWNKDYPYDSEFGEIGIRAALGGLLRTY